MRPAFSAADSPPFVSKVVAFLPRTLDCGVTFVVYEGSGVSLQMRLRAQLPTRWRMDVVGVTPDARPYNQARGLVVVFAGDSAWVRDPVTGRVETQRMTPGSAARPGMSGRLGFTLAEVLLIDDPANVELIAYVPQTIDGKLLVRYDFALRRPQVIEHVLVARESIWVEPRSGEPVRAQLYDMGGRAVGIVAPKDHRTVAPGVTLPMAIEVFLDGSRGRLTMRAEFQMANGRYYLPVRVDAYQGATPVLSLAYSACRVNASLDPALFSLGAR